MRHIIGGVIQPVSESSPSVCPVADELVLAPRTAPVVGHAARKSQETATMPPACSRAQPAASCSATLRAPGCPARSSRSCLASSRASPPVCCPLQPRHGVLITFQSCGLPSLPLLPQWRSNPGRRLISRCPALVAQQPNAKRPRRIGCAGRHWRDKIPAAALLCVSRRFR